MVVDRAEVVDDATVFGVDGAHRYGGKREYGACVVVDGPGVDQRAVARTWHGVGTVVLDQPLVGRQRVALCQVEVAVVVDETVVRNIDETAECALVGHRAIVHERVEPVIKQQGGIGVDKRGGAGGDEEFDALPHVLVAADLVGLVRPAAANGRADAGIERRQLLLCDGHGCSGQQ